MPKGKKKDYDPNTLNLALKEIRETGKIREIARKYNIPKSTLHFKLKNPTHKTSFGPPPVLTEEEELTLEIWIKEAMRKGFPLKIDDLKQSVYKFLTENPRPNKFINNYPGDGWVKGFLRRHPGIVQRTSEGVTQSSACVSESDLRKWFSEIHDYLLENNLLDIFNEPSRIFNGDESGFQLCPKTGKVLAVKGNKNVYKIDQGNAKESITVMFTFSADGSSSPPMVVYNYQRIPQKIADGVPKEWGIGRSDNGWMTSELFFEYIANIFHPYLIAKGVKFPIIYFLDGHKTHLTYGVSKLCKELGIEVIALYPNATRILQPADVAVFKPVKAAWKDAVKSWHLDNNGEPITKVNFACVLDIALKKSIKPDTLINGFRCCGLVPFDPNAVDYSKCLGGINNNSSEDGLSVLNQTDISSSNVITLAKFKDIVGHDTMLKLDTYGNNPDDNEYLSILYRLHSVFNVNSSQALSEQNIGLVIDKENTSLECIDPPRTVQSNEELMQVNDENFFNDNNIFNAHELDETNNLHAYSNNSNLNDDPFIADIVPENPIHMTPFKQVISSNNIFLNTSQINVQQLVPETSPAFKVISNSLFGNFLTLPKTPERKGKRNTIRMPFAITSAKYRAMFKEQIHKKELETKVKQDKKKKKEETKLQKEKEKIGKANKVNTNKVFATNVCKICCKATKTPNRLECDMCRAIFHVKCIPAKHQEHVPDDIAIDLFICHGCYKEDDNDIDDLSSERNSEDSSGEALTIFDMVINENKKNA